MLPSARCTSNAVGAEPPRYGSRLPCSRPLGTALSLRPDEMRRAIRAVAEGEFAVQAWLVRALQANPSIAIDAVRLVPEEKDGKSIAWRTFGVRPEGVWALLGFQNGDQLLTVNDIPVVDLETSQEVRTALKNASRIHVKFTRQRVARQVEIVSE